MYSLFLNGLLALCFEKMASFIDCTASRSLTTVALPHFKGSRATATFQK